ncbi:recombinase family protein [Brevibacterium casei]|uniref:recombinase family protein n=1 Tax=Brevibacterium casei TaxID=33889 RepID=UPI0019195CE3|nr:recombinase family protein [Brevibacterium casei]QQT70714.1 recombinase family protein [Brevibacterium casei]
MSRDTEPSALPVAIYARISRDRNGAGLGVDRQEADCRALAERLGWNVVAVYVDNDISAYSGASRPQYREMLREVRAGHIRGVVAWHTDRLHRKTTELEEFVRVAEESNLQVQTVTAGTVDLTTPSGRMVARMLGAAAQHEVDHARERMKRAKAQMAMNGQYRGGQRPYGYEPDGMTVRESEASVVRDATKSLLAGRSLAAVARELNEQGHKTSRGKDWTYARLRDVIIRPRNAGLLSRGKPDNPDVDIVGPAQWAPLVDEETWRAVHAVLTDKSRRTQNGNDVRWLGSGLYLCGKCNSPMRPAPYGGTPSRGSERKYLYRCVESAHLTVSTRQTDDHVRSVVAELVRDPRIVAAMTGDDSQLTEARARRSALAVRLETFESDYAAGAITGAQLQRATEVVNAELAQLDAQLTEGLRKTTATPVTSAPDPGAAFLAAPVDVQRAVLAAVLTVTILPAPYKGAAWTPERLSFNPVA